jgi:hypothetical protein
VATGLNNLPALYDNQGQYAKAEPLYRRALAILEKAINAGKLLTKIKRAWTYETFPERRLCNLIAKGRNEAKLPNL